MKYLLLTLGAGLLFTSCAGVRVTNVQTAAVVTERPKSIYIRPFSVEGAQFDGDQPGGEGERPIRLSLAPAEFSGALKEELEKLAPAYVLKSDESAPTGWLVTGSIERVSGGSRTKRAIAGLPQVNPYGRSHIVIHVKIHDVGATYVASDDKNETTLKRHGRVIYEFDVEGGSRWSGLRGSETAPGVGFAASFDYRNAAERIRVALDPDSLRYGTRTVQTLR